MADAGPLDERPPHLAQGSGGAFGGFGGRQAPRDLWDPGAQPERTYQAWTRTALAFTACALLGTRLADAAGPVALALSLVGAVAAFAVVRVQKHRLHSAVIRPSPRSVLAMAAMTVLLAVGALTLLLVTG